MTRPGDEPSPHSQGHTHSHASIRSGERYKGRLAAAFGLLAVFMVVEVVAGVLTNSLALLSDAGHMVTDVLGLGMALAAIQLATRGTRQRQHTFGLYRLEILAAFVNAILLFGVAIYVLIEAVQRLTGEADVLSRPMLAVAVVGLIANLVAFGLLRRGASESLNVEGAYLEVLADTLGSVGVIMAAVLLELFGWAWVDPVVGAGIGLWILPRTWRLGRQAVRILLQAAPPGIDPAAVTDDLSRISGVSGVHDVHVWTLTSEMETASAHLRVAPGVDGGAVLTRARSVLRDNYGINHATVQVEAGSGDGCGSECSW